MQLHRDVGKDITDYGVSNPEFTPTLGELIAELERDPKKFPKKKGKLKNARVVRVLSLDPHDTAYEKAIRRS